MAAQRIRAANSSGLPRCKSEGTLIDLSEGFSESSFNDVKGELPGTGTGLGRKRSIRALKTQRLSCLQAARFHIQITESELPTLRQVLNSALERQPRVWFGFDVWGGCFEFSPQ